MASHPFRLWGPHSVYKSPLMAFLLPLYQQDQILLQSLRTELRQAADGAAAQMFSPVKEMMNEDHTSWNG